MHYPNDKGSTRQNKSANKLFKSEKTFYVECGVTLDVEMIRLRIASSSDYKSVASNFNFGFSTHKKVKL